MRVSKKKHYQDEILKNAELVVLMKHKVNP